MPHRDGDAPSARPNIVLMEMYAVRTHALMLPYAHRVRMLGHPFKYCHWSHLVTCNLHVDYVAIIAYNMHVVNSFEVNNYDFL